MDTQHPADCGCQEYNELSRRQFLASTAGISAAAMFPAWLPKIVLAKSASTRDVMVSIFQRGGADGLSLVPRYDDPAYYTGRPTIAIPAPDSTSADKGTDLDGHFMFPPAMTALLPAYKATDLLITHGTGLTATEDRSHFNMQRFMETGKYNDPTVIGGWLGRHLASIPPANPTAPLRGIGLSGGLQRTLQPATGTGLYPTKTLPIPSPSAFSIGGSATTLGARTAFLQSDYATADEPLHSSALDAISALALLKSLNFTGYVPANGVTYPTSAFGQAFRSLAVLIKANVGIEAAQVDIGGWDTHSAQGPTSGGMFRVMQDFSGSIAAFYADVIATGFPVVLVSFSEFGRNARENASQGNDHGRGTTLFAMGKGIAGGRVLTQNWIPNMLAKENLDLGQDLKVTIDYRDVLSEIVQNRLQNPNLNFVFPGWTPTVLGVTR
jgi:uncharacterized protein (DUF1501 family)